MAAVGVYPVERFTAEEARRSSAVLHEPRPPGVRPREPARGREGRAVRALLAAAPRASAACSSTSSSATSTSPATSPSTRPSGSSGRGALRARLLRVRRRLGRPARRRAPRVRAGVERPHQGPRVGPADGVPRAVGSLHPVRPSSAGATATTATARCSRSPTRRGATSPTWTRSSTPTARCSPRCSSGRATGYPKEPADSDFVYKQTHQGQGVRRRAGILPAATLSNVGIYGTGQAFEALLLRMRAHPLPRRGSYAAMMLEELRKVIPSFLARVDRADRGVAWSAYLAETRTPTARWSTAPLRRRRARAPARGDRSPTSIPMPRTSSSRPSATRHPTLPEDQVLGRVRRARADERSSAQAYVGDRSNRRHGPAARSSAPTTASTSWPTTARSAICSGTACSRSSGSRCRRTTATSGRKRRRSRAGDAFDGAMARSAALRRAPIGSPTRRRTRSRSRTASASSCS